MNYIVTKCHQCNRHMILIEEELCKTDIDTYQVCTYCSSEYITVIDKYDSLLECMQSKNIYQKLNGKIKQRK